MAIDWFFSSFPIFNPLPNPVKFTFKVQYSTNLSYLFSCYLFLPFCKASYLLPWFPYSSQSDLLKLPVSGFLLNFKGKLEPNKSPCDVTLLHRYQSLSLIKTHVHWLKCPVLVSLHYRTLPLPFLPLKSLTFCLQILSQLSHHHTGLY